MDKNRLTKHVALCRKNLKSARVKCCAACPFEEEILSVYPGLKSQFDAKREKLRSVGK